MAPPPSVPTSTLKNYFPPDGAGGYRRVIRAGKDGYAEAALEKDGKEVAVLSISDAERMAYVKAKFESATEKLEGSPLLTVGSDLSTILVKDRFRDQGAQQDARCQRAQGDPRHVRPEGARLLIARVSGSDSGFGAPFEEEALRVGYRRHLTLTGADPDSGRAGDCRVRRETGPPPPTRTLSSTRPLDGVTS